MMDFYNWLKRKFCSADCRVKFSHHFIISFFSEISKFIIMGIFFYVTGRLPYYLWGICLLSVLRFYGGGPHCKTYMGSLLSSFAYMLVCVQILSSFSVSRLFQLILLSTASPPSRPYTALSLRRKGRGNASCNYTLLYSYTTFWCLYALRTFSCLPGSG